MARLLMTTSTLPRWPTDPEARFVLDLARHLPQPWEPTLLAPAAPGAAPREILDGVEVVRFRYAPIAGWETLCYPGAILSRLHGRPWLWGLVPLLILGLRRAIAAELRRSHFDCVHAHWLFPQGLAQTLGLTALPLVMTSHGGDLGLARRRPLLRPLLRRVIESADVLTLVAPGMRDQVAEMAPGYDPARVAILPMGVDTGRFRPDLRDPDWPRRHGLIPPVILFVGRLVEKKGLDVLLEALARPPLAAVPGTLAICGDGPLASTLRAHAAGLGIAERVRFLGALYHGELPIAYASSDVFCVPSVAAPNGDLDGMPTVLAEAAASGLPLVGSDLAGIPLIVRPGVTGRLVPSRDAAALSQVLAELIQDPDLRHRLGAGALAAASEFAWPRIAARFATLYAEAAERRRRRQAR